MGHKLKVDFLQRGAGLSTGTAFGYYRMISSFEAGLSALGVEFDDDAPVVLQFREPKNFRAVEGRTNVLFTMWESDIMDEVRAANLRSADFVVTCSEYSARVMRKYGADVVGIVPLGINHAALAYKKRKLSNPFVFLWVGAPNARKGWDVLGFVWNQVFRHDPNLLLYMKTTGLDNGIPTECFRSGNVFFDSRVLSDEELGDLYRQAHAFVLPTHGEGFGLTLAEAMATGAPCLVTRYSGVMDFTDSKSVYYLDFQRRNTGTDEGEVFISTLPTPDSLARRMAEVIRDYSKAVLVGKRASEKVRGLTWESASSKLRDVLLKIPGALARAA